MMLFTLAAILEAIFLRIALMGDLKPRIVETISLLLLSGLFYLVCTFIVLRGADHRPAGPGGPFLRKFRQVMDLPHGILGAALVFRLTLWPLYPALSDDVFRYRWEGKLQAAGGNPYEVRPNDREWKSLRDETFASTPGRDFRAVYGPLVEGIESITWRVVSRFERRPFAQTFWFKVPSALFDLATLAALWLFLKVKKLPPQRILIYAWCPLVLMEFWGNGHNDSIALFFLVLALAATEPRASASRLKKTLPFAFLALATAAKIWPAVLFPIFMGWPPRRWRHVLAAVPIVALVSVPYLPSRIHWSGMYENLRFLSGFLGGWRNNDSLFGALLWAGGGDFYVAKKLAFAIVCFVTVFVTLRRWPATQAALTVITALLMVSANCHAWYLTWIVPLLALHAAPPLLLWVALAPLAHEAVIQWVGTGEWNGSTGLRLYEYAPVYVFLAIWLAVPMWRRAVGGAGDYPAGRFSIGLPEASAQRKQED